MSVIPDQHIINDKAKETDTCVSQMPSHKQQIAVKSTISSQTMKTNSDRSSGQPTAMELATAANHKS